MQKPKEKKLEQAETTPKAAWQTPEIEVLPVPDLTKSGILGPRWENTWYHS